MCKNWLFSIIWWTDAAICGAVVVARCIFRLWYWHILGVSIQNLKQLGGSVVVLILGHFICSRVYGLMPFLTADQTQKCLNFCEVLR
jgi:hypothetical protein